MPRLVKKLLNFPSKKGTLTNESLLTFFILYVQYADVPQTHGGQY